MCLVCPCVTKLCSNEGQKRCVRSMAFHAEQLQLSLRVCRRTKADGPYETRVLPILLSVFLVVALSIVFASAVAQYVGLAES